MIQRDGLLSASALFDTAEISGIEREQLERQQRLTHTRLPNGVQIRDQRPMPPKALAACLVGMSPSEWYELINSRVFFWLDPARLNRQRTACEPRPQVVVTVDVEKLATAYIEHIALTPINTGNARRLPAKRGAASFVPYTAWLASGWASEAAALDTRVRPHSHQPVELTVARSIPDVMQFVIGVQELTPGQLFTPSR
uniref:Uncharacterized protein n=1 Tax=Thermosporothrix sp. COM3 TaxID=2490863 RepID=A0A455SJ23_9CHLR|nr:hypothetical protein KTC_21190 [Thermosporothrix sp. COM3]